MATMTINPTVNQTNKSWNLTWKAAGRYPIIADRIYSTLAQAQAYVDDKSTTASAIPGLVISVVNDPTPKNNGVYYVESIANSKSDAGFPIADKGVLVKVGGTETETATNYSAAKTLSNTLVVGQLIKVSNPENVEETDENGNPITNTYQAGFYIVNAPGSISALDTSTGASNELAALANRVTTLEGNRVLVSDYNTYKAEVTTALGTKASATDLSTHTADTTIHVTAEDKAKWNNAEANANAKLAEELAKLPSLYDAKGDAGKAQTAAEGYADTAVSNAIGAYTAEGVTASGLRKEIETRDAATLDAAKAYADENFDAKNSASTAAAKALEDAKKYADENFDAKNSASQALTDAQTYVDNRFTNEVTGKFDTVGSADKALEDAQAYVDGIINDTVVEGETVKGLNSRIATLEAIDHDKIAADAAATAVAGVIDGAPEKFDTLKEIAAWIAEADTAEDAASLVTRVSALEAIDHDAYKGADENVLKDAKAHADGLNTNMNARVEILEGHDIYVAATVNQAIADAKSGAISKAAEDAAAMLASYYTKTEVDDLVDDAKTAINNVITENERVTSEALTNLDDRIKDLEDNDVYVAATVNQAIADAKKAGTDAAAALNTYKTEVTQALADNSEADQAYAKAYTDLLFKSIVIIENSDIDSIFDPKTEATE